MFDGKAAQPGLADCLRGMTSVYHLCKANMLPFKINYWYPFSLEKYLVPNKYDWRVEKNDISFNSMQSVPLVRISFTNTFGDRNADIQKRYITEKIYEKKDKQIHLYTNTDCYDEFFNTEFHELFKPSPNIQSLIDKYKDEIGGSYISASFRFATLLGDLEDTFGKKLDDAEAGSLIDTCIKGLESLHTQHPNKKILMTSDSVTFINKAQQRLNFIYVIPGEIGHLAHDGEDAVVVKTLLDMFLISNADHVYMLRTDKMYRSGFAKRAALIGNKSFDEILLK